METGKFVVGRLTVKYSNLSSMFRERGISIEETDQEGLFRQMENDCINGFFHRLIKSIGEQHPILRDTNTTISVMMGREDIGVTALFLAINPPQEWIDSNISPQLQ